MRIAHLLLSALCLSFLALSPCYADVAQNNGNSDNSVLYKAAKDNGYVLLHRSKYCPLLKNETILEVSPQDKGRASVHPCSTRGNDNSVVYGKLSSETSNDNSFKTSSYKPSQPSTSYIPSSQTVPSSPSYSSAPASEYSPSSSYSGTKTTYTGTKGGNYHYSASGKKVYERKTSPSIPSYSSTPSSGYSPSSSYSGTRTTYTGPRGGRYHYSASGKKVYERKKRRR